MHYAVYMYRLGITPSAVLTKSFNQRPPVRRACNTMCVCVRACVCACVRTYVCVEVDVLHVHTYVRVEVDVLHVCTYIRVEVDVLHVICSMQQRAKE